MCVWPAISGEVTLLPDLTVGGAGAFGSPVSVATLIGGEKVAESVSKHCDSINVVSGMMKLIAAILENTADKKRTIQEFEHEMQDIKQSIDIMIEERKTALIELDTQEGDVEAFDNDYKQFHMMYDFVKAKRWSGPELYDFLVDQYAELYKWHYNTIYDMAKRAERCLQFETGITEIFVSRQGWNPKFRGISAGLAAQCWLSHPSCTNRSKPCLSRQICIWKGMCDACLRHTSCSTNAFKRSQPQFRFWKKFHKPLLACCGKDELSFSLVSTPWIDDSLGST